VGYVQRGTRWQSYCWFCKSFWDARVAAAGLQPNDTRIPEDPDQHEFVERWFEWHQGYRLEETEEGSEERIELVGEPLKDADPGFLPRTREEIESGRRVALQGDGARRERQEAQDEGPQVSLEEALDQLLDDASDEESENDEIYEITNQASAARSSAATSQPASAQDPASSAPGNLSRLDEALAEAQTAVEAAQRVRDRAEARLNNADAELSVVRERLRRIRRQHIAAGNFARVFGTREDVNNEDYVSPITSMFIRQAQWGRQNVERQRTLQEQAEALRNFADVHMQHGPESRAPIGPVPVHAPGSEEPAFLSFSPFRSQLDDVYRPYEREADRAVLRAARETSNTNAETNSDGVEADQARADHAETDQSNPFLPDSQHYHTMSARIASIRARLASTTYQPPRPAAIPDSDPVFAGLDGDNRPEPKAEEIMHVKLECKICLQQVADTACLPCGHLSMCEWCAEQWVPAREGDRTRPRDKGVRCPVCRGRVKSRVKIFVG
jgi:hypothetical protein